MPFLKRSEGIAHPHKIDSGVSSSFTKLEDYAYAYNKIRFLVEVLST